MWRACRPPIRYQNYKQQLHCLQAGGGVWKPYAAFMSFCLGYSALSGALVAFGAPLAAGSGIPEIKTYLNGVHVRGAALPRHVPRGKLRLLRSSRLQAIIASLLLMQ